MQLGPAVVLCQRQALLGECGGCEPARAAATARDIVHGDAETRQTEACEQPTRLGLVAEGLQRHGVMPRHRSHSIYQAPASDRKRVRFVLSLSHEITMCEQDQGKALKQKHAAATEATLML